MVAEHLQAAGVLTMATVTNSFLAAYGMARGFDVYDVDTDERRSACTGPPPRWCAVPSSWWTMADGQPFFLVVHLMDPHQNYGAPPPFRGTWTGDIASISRSRYGTSTGADSRTCCQRTGSSSSPPTMKRSPMWTRNSVSCVTGSPTAACWRRVW